MLSRILSALLRPFISALGWMGWGRERERRKAAEADVEALQKRDKIKDEVRNDEDDALVDRLTRR